MNGKQRDPSRTNLEIVILQTIPADSRWRAFFDDGNTQYSIPLACFALVEVRHRGKQPRRHVRPYVMCECGIVGDVDMRRGFIRVASDVDGALGQGCCPSTGNTGHLS